MFDDLRYLVEGHNHALLTCSVNDSLCCSSPCPDTPTGKADNVCEGGD